MQTATHAMLAIFPNKPDGRPSFAQTIPIKQTGAIYDFITFTVPNIRQTFNAKFGHPPSV